MPASGTDFGCSSGHWLTHDIREVAYLASRGLRRFADRQGGARLHDAHIRDAACSTVQVASVGEL